MGLMGNAVAQPSPMMGLMAQPSQAMGPWSQVAYQMAGRPNQNPFQGALPPATAATMPSGGGATSLGGSALGVLGALAKGAGSSSGSMGNTLSSLFGGGGKIASSYAPGNAAYTSGLLSDAATQAGAEGIAPVGTDAISSAADAAANATYPGLDAGGLLGGDAATGAVDAGATAAADAGATTAADTGAAAGADAAGASSGAGTALLAALPYAAAAAAVAAPFYGLTQAPYDLNGSWYNKVNSALAAGAGPAAQRGSPGYYDPQNEQQAYNYFAALGQVQGMPGYGQYQQSTPLAGVPYSTNGSPSFLAGGQGGGVRPVGKL